MKFIFRIINTLLVLFIVLLFAFHFQTELNGFFSKVQRVYLPCREPINYSLGVFDERFGLEQDEFLSILAQAENIWEEPSGQDLFAYKENGALKINLVYDTRQQATFALETIDKNIDGGQALYDKEKVKYDALQKEYAQLLSFFNQSMKLFEERQTKYNQEVAMWNTKGGAPENVYEKLEADRSALENELQKINKVQSELNQKVLAVNELAKNLNMLADRLRIEVDKYNEIGKTHTEEFEEGTYHTGPDGEWIEVYQFKDQTKLLRVLAHELGHSLGLEHVENIDAIMYRLNESSNTKATKEDLDALRRICRI